jgi:hypothetical protein
MVSSDVEMINQKLLVEKFQWAKWMQMTSERSCLCVRVKETGRGFNVELNSTWNKGF